MPSAWRNPFPGSSVAASPIGGLAASKKTAIKRKPAPLRDRQELEAEGQLSFDFGTD
jgi:hypothetical protein